MEWKRVGGGILKFFGKGEVNVGSFSSTADGGGIGLDSSRTSAHRVYADTAGKTLTAGTFRAAMARMLVGTAVTIGATIAGFVGQVKVTVVASVDWLCGLWGYAEADSGATVSDMAGVRATVDVPSGAIIATGKKAAGVMIDSITLAGTHTGKASCIHVPNPGAGSWDFFLSLAGTESGAIAVKASDLSALSASHRLVLQLGTQTVYIPVVTTWS